MRRNDIVLRVHTHISQNLPKDLEEKIKNFRAEVQKIRENSDYPFEYISNMDETPVFLDLVPWIGKGRRPFVYVPPVLKRTVSQQPCAVMQRGSYYHLLSFSKEKPSAH